MARLEVALSPVRPARGLLILALSIALITVGQLLQR
jgi:hypothetical protein